VTDLLAVKRDTAELVALPPDSANARRWLRRALSVPRNRRERFLNKMRVWQPRLPDGPRDNNGDPLIELVSSALSDSFSHLTNLRCAVAERHDQDDRRRVLAFVFEGNAAEPLALIKAQQDRRNGALASAARAIETVRGFLPRSMLTTVPELMHFSESRKGEVLVTSGLHGRSAYAELASSLKPSLLVDGHFDRAADWLASFHEASRVDDDCAASHGDYWAHNVLMARGREFGVVDWEHFKPSASRYVDLFFYPLTYGLSFPWNFYARAGPEPSFRRTFIEPNRVSRAVREYLRVYAKRTGVSHDSIRAAFGEFLVTHGTMRAGSRPHPGVRALPWGSLAKMFNSANETVLSD
jgi:hypothetical protein